MSDTLAISKRITMRTVKTAAWYLNPQEVLPDVNHQLQDLLGKQMKPRKEELSSEAYGHSDVIPDYVKRPK